MKVDLYSKSTMARAGWRTEINGGVSSCIPESPGNYEPKEYSRMAERELILCYTTYEKGQAFIEECVRQGCRVLLLTVDKLRDADWPRDSIDEIVTMPEGLNREQITNTVSYLARGRRIERIVALDEFDMEMAAHLREHLRLPGLGLTTTAYFRDKLAMRIRADQAGILVPEFTPVVNYDDLRRWMEHVPGPWLLKPRAEASAIGIKKVHSSEEVWRTLDQLGDRQSYFLMERFCAGRYLSRGCADLG